MAVALEQFVKELEDSGILAAETLKDFLPPKSSPKDVEDLAKELVRQNKLTKFQAGEVYRGNAKSLVLGNYVLLEKIGAGGMGQVYKAQNRRMDRLVAVKVLPANVTQDQAAVARFQREVRAAAMLNHPNIVAALDADCANSVHFLVMECVDGSDLSALVKKNGPFPVDKAVNYILQAARGLQAAHAEGIVHRDIKPANLLLDKKGVVKILDMGLARIESPGDAAPQAELTSSGMVMGTVDYMAPEQALNTKTADARADIYSLGCSLHFLLTGKATYGGDNLMAKLLAHQTQPIPRLRNLRNEVPEQVEAVFCKMLAKKIEDRYQSMTEVIADLEQSGTRQEQSVSTQQSIAPDADLTNFFKEIASAPRKPVLPKPKKVLLDKTWGKKNKLLLIGAGVLGVLVVLTGILVSLRTKDGTLIVEVNEPDAEVQVISKEGWIEITQKGEKRSISIAVDPGKHRLRVAKEGFAFFAQDFEMESGGEQTITATLVPVEEKPDPAWGKRAAPLAGGTKKPLAFETASFDQWVKEVAALHAEEQVEAVAKKLKDLNPAFDGKVTPTIEGGVVTELQFETKNVTDVSPVRALPGLRKLSCQMNSWQGQLLDLSPLQGTKLAFLNVNGTQVSDLSPVRDLPLTTLLARQAKISDLSPLTGMKLTTFDCGGTLVIDLSPLKGMPLSTLICSGSVADLSPLKGMPLKRLECDGNSVSDLSPLKGMPLEILWCVGPKILDLSPLKQLPLKELRCDFKPFRDTTLVRSIKTLETINGKPAVEFWKEVEAQQAAFEAWMRQVAGMPAEEQVKAVVKKLVELNSGFDGKVTPTIDSGVVTNLEFLADNVSDISPVRALAGLVYLGCRCSEPGKGKLTDLSPLKGMPLSQVYLDGTQVSDLSPLKGLSLIYFSCSYTPVSDLSPLKGMPLTYLVCKTTQVSGLSPLHGMPLGYLECSGTQISDLSPLKGMPLHGLVINETKVSDLSPLKGMPLLDGLSCFNTQVSDLSPLKNVPLKTLWCDFKPERDAAILRSIKTLETINGKPAAEFWKEVEEVKAQQATFDGWMKQVAAQPAEEQVKAVVKKLQELNQGFDGKETHQIENGLVTGLQFLTDNVTDISPVRALVGLKSIDCSGSGAGKGKLSDLSPLRGIPLTTLFCYNTTVSDLSPLIGMSLTTLDCGNTKVSDVSPLKGMPVTVLVFYQTAVSDLSPLKGMLLTHLNCDGTAVSDLSSLKGMPLETLRCGFSPVSNLSPLKGMPLMSLESSGNSVSDLSPLKGMALIHLGFGGTLVSDLSPLKDMPLKNLSLDFKPERDTELLRSIKTLENINGKPAAEFWKEVEGQKAETKP